MKDYNPESVRILTGVIVVILFVVVTLYLTSFLPALLHVDAAITR